MLESGNPTAHHNYKNADEDCNKISKKSKCMLHIVQISKMSLLYYVLGINNHVAHENKQPKVQLRNPIKQKHQFCFIHYNFYALFNSLFLRA